MSKTIYFPCTLSFLAFLVIFLASKLMYSSSQLITLITAGLSICAFMSWIVLCAFTQLYDQTLSSDNISAILYVSLAAIFISVAAGVTFNIVLCSCYSKDRGFVAWKEHSRISSYTYRFVVAISSLQLIFFRMLYSRLFRMQSCSAYFATGARLMAMSNRLAIVIMLVTFLPMTLLCAAIFYLKHSFDQTLICAVDTLILNVFLMVLLVIDSCKDGEEYFEDLLKDAPAYMQTKKYKQFDGDSMSSMIGSLASLIEENDEKKCKTEV